MNVFAKFYEIPSMILQDIKVTKRYGHTHKHTHTVGRTDVKTVYPPGGYNKHSLWGYNEGARVVTTFSQHKSKGIFPDAQGQLTPQSLV